MSTIVGSCVEYVSLESTKIGDDVVTDLFPGRCALTIDASILQI